MTTSSSFIFIVPSLLASLLAPAALAQITPGNLLVSRVGDGLAPLSGAAQARFLDEYTPAGAFVQTIALPVAAGGGNRAFTDSGTATSNGFISQSVDGRYIVAAGYDAIPGTAAVTGTTSAAVNRVIARIGLDEVVDTSTALTDAYSGNNFRSVATVDGSSFWTGGTGTGPGARYVASLGAVTSTQLSTTVTNLRVVNIQNGQLYTSSMSGAFLGVATVGTGLPTTSGQTTTLLPGFPAPGSPSTYDYFFADANTLYVADDRLTGGGILKWTQSGGTWTLQYTLAPAASTGCRGLTGYVENGVVTLFATTAVSAASSTTVVTVTDTGPAAVFTTIVTNATDTVIRDVQFVRTPASVTFSGTGCATSVGVRVLGTAGGAPVTGNLAFQLTASNTPTPSFVLFALKVGQVSPVGFPVPGTPACVLLYVLPDVLLAELASPTGTAATALPIPANSSLGGAELAVQVATFDFTLVGFDLPIGTTNAMQIVIGN